MDVNEVRAALIARIEARKNYRTIGRRLKKLEKRQKKARRRAAKARRDMLRAEKAWDKALSKSLSGKVTGELDTQKAEQLWVARAKVSQAKERLVCVVQSKQIHTSQTLTAAKKRLDITQRCIQSASHGWFEPS